MKITKKHFLSLGMIIMFIFIQVAGVLIVRDSVGAKSLWDTQQGLGLSGDAEGVIGKVGFSQTSSVEPDDIRTIVARIIKIFLGFLGVVFIGLLIFAGFKWMNSQGNETAITEAKGTIQAALIGLIIIVASYGITQLVMTYMVNISE